MPASGTLSQKQATYFLHEVLWAKGYRVNTLAPNIDNTVSAVILAFSEAIATPKLLNFEKSDRYDRISCPKFFIYYYLQYPD
ncbi:hypothetical protein [Nostoc sp.]|uniref:hypothetical protein n=1 Tax=Nostoc sp. TaxID=1180 RepID=UPI002FEE9517